MSSLPQQPEGVLLLLKPSGMTAHDVVEFVRKQLRMQRVGHTGTLDPLAAGLMVLCIGRATRLAEFLSELDKVYRFEMVLGIATSTQDAEGDIVATAPTEHITVEKVEKVLAQFVGEIEQLPPMLSAVHYKGKRLYELARRGVEVERTPRRVQIYRLTLLQWWERPVKRALVEVHCSRGTYIRTLVDDIGKALGCGAYQHFLVRTHIGPFSNADALTLEAFAEKVRGGDWQQHLIPPDQSLPMFPVLTLSRLEAQRVLNGMESVIGTLWGYPNLQDSEKVRLYDPQQRFLGVGVVKRQGNLWVCRPYKVFPPLP